MNRTQKTILRLYLPVTMLILVLDNIFPGAAGVSYLKYAVIISLFLAALKMKKTCREQAILNLALFFVVLGDFFLVFCGTFPAWSLKAAPWGMAGFLLAYLTLIAAYQKKFRVGGGEFLAALHVLIVFIPVAAVLYPHIHGTMLYGSLFFGIVLCYMTWTSISTVFRGYFRPRTAITIALSGFLMLVCDLGVAAALFHPSFAGTFVPWLKNIVWGAYIPAWTLVLTVITEDKALCQNP